MLTNLKLQRMVRFPKAKIFAQKLNIDPGYYSRIENGLVKRPNKEVIRKISETLNVDEKMLFGR